MIAVMIVALVVMIVALLVMIAAYTDHNCHILVPLQDAFILKCIQNYLDLYRDFTIVPTDMQGDCMFEALWAQLENNRPQEYHVYR